MGRRIFVGTKTALTRDARDSWTFNRDDQVKNVIRISETTVTFEPGDNVAITGARNFLLASRRTIGRWKHARHAEEHG